MKNTLEQLSQKALAIIKDPAVNDPDVIARLGQIPAKLQRIGSQFEELARETARIEELVESFAQHHHGTDSSDRQRLVSDPDFLNFGRRAAQTKLSIQIEGELLGKPGEREIISDHKASDSLVRCLMLLYEHKGAAILERLS